MTKTYSPRMVCRATGVKPVTLRSWHNEFHLATEGPIVGQAEGRRRSYTFEDVLAVVVTGRLIRRGLSRRHAAGIVNDERKHFTRPSWWLVVTPGQTPEEFYAYPGRKIESVDVYRGPGWLESRGGNSPVDIPALLEPNQLFDGAVREEVIILSVHEIAADLKRKLDVFSK